MPKRAVLAFSGGLDTSAILTWMVKEQGWEVITFTANLGQRESDSLAVAAGKSRDIGAVAHEAVDLRKELLEEFFLPAMQAHAKLEGRYLLGTSLARYPTARAAMRLAKQYEATVLAHGSTGKGNDQVRFETTWLVLNADPAYHIEGMEIFAPWKDESFLARFGNGGRKIMRAYLEEMKVPVPSGGSDAPDPYSQDENLLHISSEGVVLEQPEESHVDKVIYTRLTDPRRAPDTPELARIWFARGVPVRLEVLDERGNTLQAPVEGDLVRVFTAADTLAGRHGIGLLDMVEHRYVGLKSRGVYEAPGHTLLEAAHADLEGIVQDGPVLDEKYAQAPRLARLIYTGGWFSQELRRYLASLAEDQQRVNGWSLVRLYKGAVLPVARWSAASLYDPGLVSFNDMTGAGFDPRKARGFIDVQALHMWAAERARHVGEGTGR
ncbi:MAG TPA: argininosuccinate synthase [Dehalococcoidia bacterium]|nr:argininosuccinate synthase [Dehalococcoidia bacterium]